MLSEMLHHFQSLNYSTPFLLPLTPEAFHTNSWRVDIAIVTLSVFNI